jgi:ADP-ribose pyrophosphatase
VSIPKIILDNIVVQTPWVHIIERHVDFGGGSVPEIYHCVNQPDYITVIPVDLSGHTVLVKQYRPAMRDYTWEFPAGTQEAGESPEASALRELVEETGLQASALHNLGSFAADTGRHCNRIHNFVAEVDLSKPALSPEVGMEACWVTFSELFTMIREGRFPAQLQIAALALALMHPKAGRSIPRRESEILGGCWTPRPAADQLPG